MEEETRTVPTTPTTQPEKSWDQVSWLLLSQIWSVVSMIQRENCVNIKSLIYWHDSISQNDQDLISHCLCWENMIGVLSACVAWVCACTQHLMSSAADLGQRNKFAVVNNCLWGAPAWLQSSVRKWEIRKTEILTTILVSKIVILSCCEGMSGDVESTMSKNMHKHCNHMSDTCWTLLLQIIVKTWWVMILKLKFTWSLTCSLSIVKLDSNIFYIINLNKHRPWYLLPFGFVAMAVAADFFLTTAIHLRMHLLRWLEAKSLVFTTGLWGSVFNCSIGDNHDSIQ